MKNAMKKLMAFALVAVMLIGALPFAASADTVPLIVYKGDTQVYGNQPNQYATAGETLTVDQIAAACDIEKYEVNSIHINNGSGVGWGTVVEFTAGSSVTIKYVLKENATPPAQISFTVDYDNGVEKNFTMTEGELIGSTALPADAAVYGSKTGFKFDHYEMNGLQPTANWKVSNDIKDRVIKAVWTQIGCTECGWADGTGHSNDCSKNPNKPTQAPEEPEEPEVQEPTDTKAYLNVFVNGVKKVQTYGSVNENIPVANCISAAEVNAANVTSVVLNNVNLPKDGSFNLGAAGSTTDIYLNVATSTGNTGNTGSTGGSSSNDTTEYAYAYIYVGDNSGYSRVYKNARAFSIAGVVDEFDDDMTSKHYSFDYYTIDGETGKNYDDSDVVQPGEVARVYVKVTESKLNNNKVYLQIYLNNNFDTPAKTLNVTSMASEDGLNLYGNVEDLILDNFTAKNSKGIKMDGMYESVGSWVADFLEDDKVSKRTADQIIEAKEESFVVYNIMVTNAKTGSSSTADDTNPKTGDQIMVPVAIMAVSASVLAAVAFYLNKKRVY